MQSWSDLRRKGLKQVQQSIRHLDVTTWLLRDFFRFLSWRSLAITLTGAASVGMKFVAAAMLHAFINALSEHDTVQLPGFPELSIDIREFFVAGVIAGLILMGVSTLLQVKVRLIAIAAARRYEEYCTRRLVNLASRLPHKDAGWASEVYRAEPLQVFFGYVRSAGMLARQLTRILPSLISFGLSCLVLLWLNPPTTAALAAVALIILLVQYPLNNRAARASTKNELHRREASQRLGQLFNQLRQGPLPLAHDGALLNVLFERRGPLGRDLASFSQRVDGGVLATMVSQLGVYVLLGVVLLTLGLDIIAGRQSWANVAVYVVVVQFALRDFLSVGRLLSSVSVHYGQVERYMNFVRSASRASESGWASTGSRGLPTLKVPAMNGAASTLPLGDGGLIAVFVPPQGSLPFAVMFLDALDSLSGTEFALPAWIDASLLDPRLPLAENLALPATTDLAAVERAVMRFAPVDFPAIKPGWSKRTPASFPDGLPDWLVCALKVVAARARGHGCLALQAMLARKLGKAWRSACRECLADGVLFVIHRNPDLIGRYGEHAALIGDTDGFLCWAPIDKTDLTAITHFCREVSAAAKLVPTPSDDENVLLADG